jgi:2-iminobutanoate/2-iminopropanoate deaminase
VNSRLKFALWSLALVVVASNAAAQYRPVVRPPGSALERVVRRTVFLADMRDVAKMNEVYVIFFPQDPPAPSTVAVSGLALGARVEV